MQGTSDHQPIDFQQIRQRQNVQNKILIIIIY